VGYDFFARYIDRIEAFCRGLDILPRTGAPRADIRIGLRIAVFERRITVAYRVHERTVINLRVFGAGQDIVAALV
jgi:toxin ParE1/3/4